ncbi:hypothetical protein FAES_1853 [Fibrella aestuarina BUZ 2]|uniref:Uncharacterized protein n=1 Tax=Fibrella aestuarina BUZ 2 TaxID=1166018 RepID=I0K6W0_9BACT|nr:hypothetical protein [Fibrella aestuarina]CCG99863.1 hypothetical protein FAES_1853 [Fibrella aestuarina BUZ 2]
MTTDQTEALEAVVSEVSSQPDPTTLATIPAAELEAISATDQQLARLLTEAERIAALGVPKTQAEADLVHDFTMVAVKVRTDAEKLAKKIAAPFKAQYDAIKAEGERIGEEARKAEALTRPLKTVWDDADKERKRQIAEARAAEERAKAARTLERASALHALGVLSQAGYYVYGEIRIEAIELTTLPDEEWNTLYGQVEAAHAEQKRKDEEFAEQLRRDVEAEKKRQQDEAAALKRQQDELLDGRLALRIDKLVGMGAYEEDEFHIVYDRVWTITDKAELRACSDGTFNQMVVDLDAYKVRAAERILEKAEQYRIKGETIKRRTEQLTSLGFALEGGKWAYPDYDKTIPNSGLEYWREDSQFDSFVSEFTNWKTEQANAAKQAEADEKARKKADKERTQRLAKDKNLLHKFALSIGNLAFPEPENDESKALLIEFNARRVALAEEFIERIRTL